MISTHHKNGHATRHTTRAKIIPFSAISDVNPTPE